MMKEDVEAQSLLEDTNPCIILDTKMQPTPWYRRSKFWAILGVVAVIVIVSICNIKASEDSPDDSTTSQTPPITMEMPSTNMKMNGS